jgi:(R,R)-butanediol dehydrogenase/meso-butanediol dehydrogenase/diacetyl reductase
VEEAAMVEPLSVAWFGVKRTQFQKGQTALVIGAGPIGLFTVKILKALGASFIAVSEVVEGRAKVAKAFGADLVCNPKDGNLLEEIKKRTDGRGVDVCIELAVG